MQLTMFAPPQDSMPESSGGKTSPASSRTRKTPSGASSRPWWVNPTLSSLQGEGGRTLVLCMAPSETQRGGFSTLNTSAWPNDAAVCSLSQVLETGSIPARFFLSPVACAGILRRAEKRGKELPEALAMALLAVAAGPQT